MKISKNIRVPNEILASIDFNNSVWGGSAEPQIAINENEISFEINVKVPGIESENIKIELIDDNLLIYQMVPVLSKTENNGFMARTFTNFTLPNNIEKEHIEASNIDSAWQITLPKNNDKKGFRKSINY